MINFFFFFGRGWGTLYSQAPITGHDKVIFLTRILANTNKLQLMEATILQLLTGYSIALMSFLVSAV